jgi:hypothetical protein
MGFFVIYMVAFVIIVRNSRTYALIPFPNPSCLPFSPLFDEDKIPKQ